MVWLFIGHILKIQGKDYDILEYIPITYTTDRHKVTRPLFPFSEVGLYPVFLWMVLSYPSFHKTNLELANELMIMSDHVKAGTIDFLCQWHSVMMLTKEILMEQATGTRGGNFY